MAAELARRRKDRGVKLNHPEAVAYITDWCLERARDGQSVPDIRSEATQLLSHEDVMDGVPEMIPMVQVEPMFPDGRKLVTVHDPIRTDEETFVAYDDKDERPTEEDTLADGGDSTGTQASDEDER